MAFQLESMERKPMSVVSITNSRPRPSIPMLYEQSELRGGQARLGSLSAEQVAAVEALTRGLVNKFLHPPMQAMKQAARENNSARLDALRSEEHTSELQSLRHLV